MKRFGIAVIVLVVLGSGCGRRQSDPSEVVQGLMRAYETRDDSLYASLLAPDFKYSFEPAGADSGDILEWGKEEEVMATGNLFRTPDVEQLVFRLDYSPAKAAEGRGRDGWMMIPVQGGQMKVMVKNKEPMQVDLNRQELLVRPKDVGKKKGAIGWEIVEWHDFPVPIEVGEPAESPR
jgi:hypothetical protein